MTEIARDRVAALLNPERIALVGASDKSTFSALIHGNLVAGGWEDRIHLVNPRSSEVHGRPTSPTCTDIGQPIDLAMIMVPAAIAPDAIRDAAAAGARSILLLSSGYAEMGEEGRRRQRELVDLATELDVFVLGPNSLGFVNVHASIAAMAQGAPPTDPGHVALISQSGASCGAMKDFAAISDVGLSHVITVGNEAMVSVGHLIDALVDDDNVRAFAVFMEGMADADVFRQAANRARERGKAIVVLKAGRSELAATAAASHTGTLVGDDRVVDAVFRRLGIIRVDTIEDMLVTAGLAAHTGPISGDGVGVVSMSGGACDIVADLAEPGGVRIADLSAQTRERLDAELPEYGHPNNPLDITGAGVIDPDLWTRTIEVMGADPDVEVMTVVHNLPLGDSESAFYGQKYINAIGRGLSSLTVPSFYVTQVTQPIGKQARGVLEEAGITHVVPGMRLALDAIGRISDWSTTVLSNIAAWDPRQDGIVIEAPHRPLSEVEGRALLEQAGVPMVTAHHVYSAHEAESVATSIGAPVAMKIVSADIAHKTDVGGVRLNVGIDDVASAYDGIISACTGHGDLDGVLISPMLDEGVDLLVGVTRDDDWGVVLAVGLGGIFVEILDDVVLMPLPVTPELVLASLDRLRASALLQGARGQTPVDRRKLAEVVAAIGDLAAALGPELQALEVNPLRARGGDIHALDVLVSWANETN